MPRPMVDLFELHRGVSSDADGACELGHQVRICPEVLLEHLRLEKPFITGDFCHFPGGKGYFSSPPEYVQLHPILSFLIALRKERP